MAKKASASTIGAAPAQTPQERFDEHYPRIRSAKSDLDEKQTAATAANSVYRNALKAYKKAGGDADALLEAMRLQKLEPADATKHLSGINWHLLALGVPVGTQLGLFPDGETVAKKVDDARLHGKDAEPFDIGKRPISTEASVREAKASGYEAGVEGKPRNANPHPEGSPEYLGWDGCWLDGQQKLGARLAGRGRGHEERPSA